MQRQSRRAPGPGIDAKPLSCKRLQPGLTGARRPLSPKKISDKTQSFLLDARFDISRLRGRGPR